MTLWASDGWMVFTSALGVPGPGVDRQVDGSLQYEGRIKEVVRYGVWMDRFAFEKHAATISRNWLTLGGAGSSGSARPQISKHHNTENRSPG